ncbi:glycosyltransferase family 4 protein [Patescibacteria group bacterium]
MKESIKTFTNKIVYNKWFVKLKTTIEGLQNRFSDKIVSIVITNALLIGFQALYLRLRLEYVNSQIPFWYTKMWGDYQLADKVWLNLFPIVSLAILLVGLAFTIPIKRYFIRYGVNLIGMVTISANILLTASMIRIIFKASAPFEPIINPLYLDLIVPAILSFLLVQFVLPKFINYAKDRDIVTSPAIHSHPGMLLSEPSARGGGFIYGIVFLVLSAVFVGFPTSLIPFYVALFLLSILGFIDDYQNTHPETKLRLLESPYIRLGLLLVIVAALTTLGAKIFSVSNPFGGILFFNSQFVSIIITTVWITWFLNVLSWSNGIDGQYAGIVGIASVLIILLALRFNPLEVEYKRVAIMGAISAGLCLGFVRYTWHPSKIMWGFGAMTAGLVLAFLSILISSKILTSVIIILIPFLDAFVTVLRRLLQGKSPLKGDRGHLHHILLDRGWSVRKIALFYWITTAVFGGIGYLTAERFTLQMGLTLMGIAAFIIVMLNLRFKKEIIAPDNPLPEN